MTELIEQLADLVGFHHSYIDSFGQQVLVNKEARGALLTAMGYDLSNEQAIAASVEQLSQKSWRNILPSAHIAKAEESQHHLVISLKAGVAEQISWRIATEQGEQLSADVKLADLLVVEQASFAGEEFIKYQLILPELALGYHQLTVSYGSQQQSCHLIFAPQTCYSPQEACSEKMWGYAAQLYSLRSENNWGMGDFGDLLQLVKDSAQRGVSAIGLNPLHPLFQNNPAHRSPYSPTSRCFLNTMYLDATKVVNYLDCQVAQDKVASDQFQAKIKSAKASELIDYPAVAELKFDVLTLLFNDFNHYKATKYQQTYQDFEQFKAKHGKDLLRLATFEALYEHVRASDFHAYGWKQWPQEFQSIDSEAVKKFQQEHAERIDYFAFLQWQAHSQLMAVTNEAKQQGMPVGLYLDLAVGCDGSGVDVWSDPEVYVSGAAVGAPPDLMNVLGQDWGLTPMNPVALQDQGYMPLVKALRSNMQYAGALRIDHILGLMRQYWVAPGMAADQGVYITFPLAEILRIIALESRRAECVVIGEDLGTVPDGFGEIMAAAGLLSYKVLFFERWESGFFKRPELYPEQSMVTVSTHDLPTLSGWWTGRDLEWRQSLNLYPNDEMKQEEASSRVEDRQLLVSALEDLSVIDMTKSPQQAPAQKSRELSLSVQKFLAQAPSHIQLIPLEDSLELEEQVNIPGTIDQHPNWRQKLPVTIEQLWQTDAVVDLVKVMQTARPSSFSQT